MKKQWFVLLIALMLMLPALALHHTFSAYAEEESVLPSDDNLVLAIQMAGLGHDPTNYDIVKDLPSIDLSGYDIISLDGLDYWNFDNLKTLNLSQNRISQILGEHFSTMPLLEEINISNNFVSNVSLSGMALKRFIANGNALTQIDLNFFADEGGTYANLNGNKFESLDSITNSLNTNSPTVWLSGNKITLDQDELVPTNYELALQGARGGDKFVTSLVVTNYQSLVFPNLVITINNEEVPLGQTVLSYGEYAVKFYDDETLLTAPLSAYTFRVVPEKPSILFFVRGEEVPYANLFEEQVQLIFTSPVEGGTMFFRVGMGEWQDGTELNIRLTGNFNISTQVRIAGVVSDNQSIVVNIRLVKPIWFFLGFFTFVAFLMVLFFGVYYINRSKNWKKK